MTEAYDLEAQVLAEIEEMERAAAELRRRARAVESEQERRQLDRGAEDLKEKVACLLPELS